MIYRHKEATELGMTEEQYCMLIELAESGDEEEI